MKRLLLILPVLFLVGCNSLGRLFPQYEKPDQPTEPAIPSHLHGFTIVDHQGFAPFNIHDYVIVKVKRKGEDWHVCNRYEVHITTTGTGGVFFGNIEYPTFDSNGNLIYLVITHDPVAPTGTEYDIQAVQVYRAN